MSKALDDRAVLVRTLQALETTPHCSFFACPGPDNKPVPMETCVQAATVWDLRNYMERHGGWCPEHAQELSRCHSKDAREAAYQVLHCSDATVSFLCHCRPVARSKTGKDVTEETLAMGVPHDEQCVTRTGTLNTAESLARRNPAVQYRPGTQE